MANTIFDALGGSQGQQRGRRNLAPALLQHIQNFQGNPIEQLQAKVNESGISQEQYNQLHSAAESIARKMMGVLPRK